MHSDEATMIFGPFSFVVSASFSVSRIQVDVVGAVGLAHPFRADAAHRFGDRMLPVWRERFFAREDRMSCPPVAAE